MIIPFFGEQPDYLPLFLKSCVPATRFRFHIFSDTAPPNDTPENVTWHKSSHEETYRRANLVTGCSAVPASLHAICNLRPFFPLMYPEAIQDAEYWGYCDLDVMFGDIDRVLTEFERSNADGFTSHWKYCVGHFTFFRNNAKVNRIGFEIENWNSAVGESVCVHIDEFGIFEAARRTGIKIRCLDLLDNELKNAFSPTGITFNHLGEVADMSVPEPDCLVVWKDGHVYYEDSYRNCEVAYVHFMGTKSRRHMCCVNRCKIESTRSHTFCQLGCDRVATRAQMKSLSYRMARFWHLGLAESKARIGRTIRSSIGTDRFFALKHWFGFRR